MHHEMINDFSTHGPLRGFLFTLRNYQSSKFRSKPNMSAGIQNVADHTAHAIR